MGSSVSNCSSLTVTCTTPPLRWHQLSWNVWDSWAWLKTPLRRFDTQSSKLSRLPNLIIFLWLPGSCWLSHNPLLLTRSVISVLYTILLNYKTAIYCLGRLHIVPETLAETMQQHIRPWPQEPKTSFGVCLKHCLWHVCIHFLKLFFDWSKFQACLETSHHHWCGRDVCCIVMLFRSGCIHMFIFCVWKHVSGVFIKDFTILHINSTIYTNDGCISKNKFAILSAQKRYLYIQWVLLIW